MPINPTPAVDRPRGVGFPHMWQEIPYYVGSWVKVKHCQPYELPQGLPEGASVKVIKKDIGSRIVEYRRKQFEIPMACIDRPLKEVRD